LAASIPDGGGIAGAAEQGAHSTDVKAYRFASGGKRRASEQAIGVTKGGRNTKLHALVDNYGDRGLII
jgi:hypothetical protein